MSFASIASFERGRSTSAFARGFNGFRRRRQVVSPSSECNDDSPTSVQSSVSSWWDNVFEASDVLYLNRNSSVEESNIRKNLPYSPSVMGAVKQDSFPSASQGVTSTRMACLKDSQVQDQLWSPDQKMYDRPSCCHAVSVEPTSRSPGSLGVTRTSAASSLEERHTRGLCTLGIPQSSSENSGSLLVCISDAACPIQQPEDTPDILNRSESEKNQGLYPSMLKVHAARLALNAGKEHFSSKGKLRPARQLQPSCAVSCKRCSTPRLSEQERLIIFTEFWNLQNHKRQWEFLFDCIAVFAPQRKFSAKGAKGEKSVHRVYYFRVDNRKRKVCKTMFLRTLSVCDSWISSALSHCNSDGISAPDRRGKNVITLP